MSLTLPSFFYAQLLHKQRFFNSVLPKITDGYSATKGRSRQQGRPAGAAADSLSQSLQGLQGKRST